MTAYTSPDALPYPDDYQKPADSPSAFAALAGAVQAALTSVRDYATSRVIDSVNGTNADIAPSQKSVNSMKTALEASIAAVAARVITAGNGLTGGGDLTANRTINVGAGTGITVAADSVSVNKGTLDGWYQPKNTSTAAIASEGTTQVGDKGIGVRVLDFGSLGAGQESGVLSFTINDGSYVIASLQHHSTYLLVSCNIATEGATQRVDVKVRNSTTSTTHTNIKVHVLVVNP
jgi:hypothetical protein